MVFAYLTNTPLEQALAEYPAFLRQRGFAPRTETVPAAAALGRVTGRCTPASAPPTTPPAPWTASPWRLLTPPPPPRPPL